jgi:hypothetical protein
MSMPLAERVLACCTGGNPCLSSALEVTLLSNFMQLATNNKLFKLVINTYNATSSVNKARELETVGFAGAVNLFGR